MSLVRVDRTEIQPGMTLRVAEYRGGLLVGRGEYAADRDAVVAEVEVLPPYGTNPPAVLVVFEGQGTATPVGHDAVYQVVA